MCFAEETQFSMVASTEIEKHKNHLFKLTPETDLLRTSILYGANAHGKTKLIEAIDFAKQLIVNGVQKTKMNWIAVYIRYYPNFFWKLI